VFAVSRSRNARVVATSDVQEVGGSPKIGAAHQAMMRRARELRREFERTRANLIGSEFDLAMTFASFDLDAGRDAEKRTKSERSARLAYDTAIHFLAAAQLPEAELSELNRRRQEVEAELKKLHDSMAAVKQKRPDGVVRRSPAVLWHGGSTPDTQERGWPTLPEPKGLRAGPPSSRRRTRVP